MRYPRLLVYASGKHTADLLRPIAEENRWSFSEPRSSDACKKLLIEGDPAVLVLRIGRDVIRELALLDEIATLWPETGTIVLSDTENETLAALAWDLGTHAVLFPPLARDQLPALVIGLMNRAVAVQGAPVRSSLETDGSAEVNSPIEEDDVTSAGT